MYVFILFALYHTQLISSYVLCNYKKNNQINLLPTLSITNKINCNNLHSKSLLYNQINNRDSNNKNNKQPLSDDQITDKKPSAFDEVASKGLAGVLAIACAEAIFWALGLMIINN